MGKIFGGSKSKQQSQSTSTQSSSNRAYDTIAPTLAPAVQAAPAATTAYQDFLAGDMTGFNRYKDAAGYDFAESQGIRDLTANSSGLGTLLSGSTGKALQTFGTNLKSQFANNYLSQLLGLNQAGLGAASALTGAGNVSTGQSQSTSSGKSSQKAGLGGLLGGAASGIASG